MKVHKEYVCRVVGRFPQKLEVNDPLLVIDHAKGLVQVCVSAIRTSLKLKKVQISIYEA